MPRAEKTTMELRKNLDKIRESTAGYKSTGTSCQIKHRKDICGDSKSEKDTSGAEESDEKTDIHN